MYRLPATRRQNSGSFASLARNFGTAASSTLPSITRSKDRPKYVIVVGLDHSSASERALHEAFALGCTKHGVQMHVVNVRSALDETTAPNEALLPPWENRAAELREYVARKAAAFEATKGRAPFQNVHTHQRMNDPAHQMSQLATDVGGAPEGDASLGPHHRACVNHSTSEQRSHRAVGSAKRGQRDESLLANAARQVGAIAIRQEGDAPIMSLVRILL